LIKRLEPSAAHRQLNGWISIGYQLIRKKKKKKSPKMSIQTQSTQTQNRNLDLLYDDGNTIKGMLALKRKKSMGKIK
jgi:hypothetical protein